MALWCVPNSQRILLEEFEDALLCYHSDSGNTHILTLFPAEIFLLIKHAPTEESVLARQMAELCDESDDQVWRAKVHSVLKGLKKLGLAQCK